MQGVHLSAKSTITTNSVAAVYLYISKNGFREVNLDQISPELVVCRFAFLDTSTRPLRRRDHDPLQHLRVSMPVYEGENRRFITMIGETKQLRIRHPTGVALCPEISVFAVGTVECITYSNVQH